jgi:hypothetical protein
LGSSPARVDAGDQERQRRLRYLRWGICRYPDTSMGSLRVRRFLSSRAIRRRLLQLALLVGSLLLAVGVSAVLSAKVGFAAGLPITSKPLTTHTAASTVPVSTCTLTASADDYVAQDDNSNFGSATELRVQSYQTTILLLTTQRNRRSFVKFDLSSCSIPGVARVTSATLSVFLATAPTLNRTWNISRVTSSWSENNIAWPGPTATASTSVTTGTTSNVTLSANVTSDVASFVSGSQTNHGWRFSDSAENSSTQQNGQFRSREFGTASQRPTLVINYYP